MLFITLQYAGKLEWCNYCRQELFSCLKDKEEIDPNDVNFCVVYVYWEDIDN